MLGAICKASVMNFILFDNNRSEISAVGQLDNNFHSFVIKHLYPLPTLSYDKIKTLTVNEISFPNFMEEPITMARSFLQKDSIHALDIAVYFSNRRPLMDLTKQIKFSISFLENSKSDKDNN